VGVTAGDKITAEAADLGVLKRSCCLHQAGKGKKRKSAGKMEKMRAEGSSRAQEGPLFFVLTKNGEQKRGSASN
jgi:hypothetical protein